MVVLIPVGLAVIVVAVTVTLALAWRASERAMHPGPATPARRLSDFPELEPEQVSVDSATGVRLAGRFFAGRSRATIVLTHGYGGNQDEMLPTAGALHRAGFSVFTYDLRGTGDSGGAVTFGVREQEDLRSAVDYLVSRSDVDDEKIGALGFSLGGATTLLAAAADPRIKVVAADSAWANVYHWLRPSIAKLLHPKDPFSPLSLKLIEWRAAIDLDELRPVEDVGRLSPRPLMLIHGTADAVVPLRDSEHLLAAAGAPAELWRVDGASHGDTVAPGGATASERVAAFFQRSLDPAMD